MKKHFFYFLLTAFIFNFLFLNNFALAQLGGIPFIGGIPSIGQSIGNIAGAIVDGIRQAFVNLLLRFLNILFRVFALLFILIINIIVITLWAFLMLPLVVFSNLIDFVSSLNPLENDNVPAVALWTALRTWGYIILTFVGLYAGFQWLFGEDTKAKRLIFNILLVALLINFSFLFVQEAFNIVWTIEQGISGNNNNNNRNGVGQIFLNAALTVTPWSLAERIYGQNENVRMPGRVDQRQNFENGNFIPNLAENIARYIGGIFDQIFPSDQNSNELGRRNNNQPEELTASINNQSFNGLIITIFPPLVSIVFTFIILLITLIALALYIVRYLVITFLAAVSSIAIASVAFPEIRIGGKVFSLNFFDQWFSYFVKWTLVIPVFLILFLASHNVFMQFLDRGGINAGSFPGLVQTVLSLIVIIGSFLLSIIFTEELTGKVAGLAKGFALGASAYLGGLAVGKALERSGNKAADILEKTGGKIAESPLPIALRARGVQLQKKAEELRENINKESLANKQALVSYYLEKSRLTGSKEALQRSLQLIEEEQNPWIKRNLILEFNLSDKEIGRILTDKNYTDEARRILSLMGDSKAPRKSRERLAKIVRGMPARKFVLASTNQALYEMWDALHTEIQKEFLEAIEDLKKEDLIKEFAKLKKDDWQNIHRLSQSYPNAYELISKNYNKASSNAFVAFIETVVNKNINTLKNNIQYYPELFRYLDKDIISPDFAKELLKEGLNRSAPETIDNFFSTWFRLKDQNPQLAKEIQDILRDFSADSKKSEFLLPTQKTKIESILSVKI